MKTKRKMKKLMALFLAASVLMLFNPATHAEELINKHPTVEALNLEFNEFEWIFITPDFEQMTYVGTSQFGDKNREKFETELNSIGSVKYLKPGKSVYGDMIIGTNWNARYSYSFESESVLNINGQRYQLNTEQMQHIKNIAKTIEESEYSSRYPLWFAWMNPSNFKSFTQYQTLVPDQDFDASSYRAENNRSFPAEVNFIAFVLFRDYFDIEKGERYEVGSVELPKDQDYYEMTIAFKSGTSYKVMAHDKTMLLESSERTFGCKYTLVSKKIYPATSIREAYSDWTYRWAYPPWQSIM